MLLRLSAKNAQKIVEEMYDIIKQDINMMDNKGIIIASTDKTRIGQFHEGAKRAIKLKKEIIVNKDDEFQGSKKGINLPLMLWDEILGVIGITGEKKDVEKYGQIIKKMTEILLKEVYLESQQRLEEEAKKQFVEELIFENFGKDDLMITRANFLGINILIPRSVLVLEIVDNYLSDMYSDMDRGMKREAIRKKIFKEIAEVFAYNSDNIVVSSGSKSIILFSPTNSKEKEEAFLRQRINKIKIAVQQKYQLRLAVGGGRKYDTPKDLHKSYMEAEKCLNFSKMDEDYRIVIYDDLNLELLIEVLPLESIHNFCKKILNMDNKDKEEQFIDTLKMFFKKNGSINETAKELFIHKNTLQYRLNRIHKTTGFNPRKFDEAIVLYLSIVLQQYADSK